MARIKVEDLPKDMKVSREEMKRVFGGESYKPIMLPRGGSEGAVHGGIGNQTIVIHQPTPEDRFFWAPEDYK